MRGFPDAYTNYTTIRPQCLNPHHQLCGRKRYARDFVYGERNSLPFSTAGTHLEVRLPHAPGLGNGEGTRD